MIQFFKPTKSKLVVFSIFALYFGFTLLLILFGGDISTSGFWGSVLKCFIPAFVVMVWIGMLFGLRPDYYLDGKGPMPTQSEVAIQWIGGVAFGVAVLYLLACIIGYGYDLRKQKMNSRLRGNDGK